MTNKPRLFIGSSVEGHGIATELQRGLEYDVEVTLWSQGVFGLSKGTLESLIEAANDNDYAALVLTADDLTVKRDDNKHSPRDNVIFELGLFMGSLGRERTFMVYCRDSPPDLPTDLAGITAATFAKRDDGNLQRAMGTACTEIRSAIEKIEASVAPRKLKVGVTLLLLEDGDYAIYFEFGNDVPFQYQCRILDKDNTFLSSVQLGWDEAHPQPDKRTLLVKKTFKMPKNAEQHLTLKVPIRTFPTPKSPPIQATICQEYQLVDGNPQKISQRLE